MKQVKVLTIKPQRNEVEYGVQEDGRWIVHGMVFTRELTESCTIQDIQAAAEADAVAKGIGEL